MAGMDYAAHNAEVREVWDLYHKGTPRRVPMIIGTSVRFTILDPSRNVTGATFESYFNDPDIMLDAQLHHHDFVRHHLPQDAEMGLPEAWNVHVDFQNSYEALWYGAPLRFIAGDVPDTPPFLTEESKRAFIDAGPPEPFSGWMGRCIEFYEHICDRAKDFEFRGRPVNVAIGPGLGADGVFTTACALRGPTELCLDMYVDPDFYHALMDLLVTATIRRIRAFRERMGQPAESEAWGFADDSIQLLSVATYREMVLPYHRRLVEAFGPKGPNSIHLCGDATRHFATLRDELKVMAFDTGFPVDHGALREELGPDVQINGGPHVEILRTGTPAAVREETRRILGSGVMRGGKFVLREGNNLAPGTPIANVETMYAACKEFGVY